MGSPGAQAQEAYTAEIKFFAFTSCPPGWVEANGQLLPIDPSNEASQANQALFDVIGTTYGGDGTTSFAVPNLAGVVSTTETPPPPTTTAQRGGKKSGEIPLAMVPKQTHKPQRVKVHGAEDEAPTTPEDGTGTPILACIALEGFSPSTPALVPTGTSPLGGEVPPESEVPPLNGEVPPGGELPPEDDVPEDELPEDEVSEAG
jgi:microcystin-dependent protein